MRRSLGWAAVVVTVAVFASGCSRRGPGVAPPAGSTQPSPTPSGAVASAAPSPSSAVSASLKVTATVPVPGVESDPITDRVLAAEAPDGAVYAVGGQDDRTVYAVGADGVTTVAEHIARPIWDLAADDQYLYLATTGTPGTPGGSFGSDVTAYIRTTGKEVRSWRLTGQTGEFNGNPAESYTVMAATAGKLWLLNGAFNNPALVTADPGSGATATVVAGLPNSYASGFAAGPSGAYVVTHDGATLVKVSADGSQVSAPTGITGLEAGALVVAETVAGGRLLVDRYLQGPAGGVEIYTYDAATLAPTGAGTTTVASVPMAWTTAGLLALAEAGSSGCPRASSGAWCAGLASLPAGSPSAGSALAPVGISGLTALPGDGAVSVLLGPHAAVFTETGSGVELVRIG